MVSDVSGVIVELTVVAVGSSRGKGSDLIEISERLKKKHLLVVI